MSCHCRLGGSLGTVHRTRSFWDSDVQILLASTSLETQTSNTAHLEFIRKLGGGSSKVGTEMLQRQLLRHAQHLSPGENRMEASMLQSIVKWPCKDSIYLSVTITVYRPNASDDVVCCIQLENTRSGELRSLSQIYSLLRQSLQSDKPAEPVLECVQPVAQQSEDFSNESSDLIEMWKRYNSKDGMTSYSNLGLPISASSADPGTLYDSLFHLK